MSDENLAGSWQYGIPVTRQFRAHRSRLEKSFRLSVFVYTASAVKFYAPLFEIWVSFRVKRSSHASSDSPVTAACTAQKLLLNACEIVVYGEKPSTSPPAFDIDRPLPAYCISPKI